MTSIKQLPVSKLKSGMVLNASVRTKRGQTIAKAGTVLNHQLIARLNFSHIESVAVEIDLDNEQISDAPASAQAQVYRDLSQAILHNEELSIPTPMSFEDLEKLVADYGH